MEDPLQTPALRRRRTVRALFALTASVLAASCFSQTIPVDLSRATILPVVAPDKEAAPNAQPVSLVRPRDVRTEQKLSSVVEASAMPIMISQTFVPASETNLWVGNGLADGLENAGYKVKRVNSVEAADTPVVISVDLTELGPAKVTGIHIHFTARCRMKIAATIRIAKAGRVLSDSQYEAEGLQEGGTCFDQSTLTLASRKALEELLANAIPQIGLILRSATQPDIATAPPTLGAAR